ncbi:MAG: hypothetical protein H7A32_03565 [Deltaproteobacteria bacterium]|nr:hypothetical protein [Deltaproteobacteria bacterium]
MQRKEAQESVCVAKYRVTFQEEYSLNNFEEDFMASIDNKKEYQSSVFPSCDEVELVCSSEEPTVCESELVSLPEDHYPQLTLTDDYFLRVDLLDYYEHTETEEKHLCSEQKKDESGQVKTFWKMSRVFFEDMQKKIIPACDEVPAIVGPVKEVEGNLQIVQKAGKSSYDIALGDAWIFARDYVDQLFPEGVDRLKIGQQICVKQSVDDNGNETLVWRMAKSFYETLVQNESPELGSLDILDAMPGAEETRGLLNTPFEPVPNTAFDTEWIPLGYLSEAEAARARYKFGATGERIDWIRQANSPGEDGKALYYVSVRIAEKGALEWEAELAVVQSGAYGASAEDGLRAAKLRELLNQQVLIHSALKNLPDLPVDLNQFSENFWQGCDLENIEGQQAEYIASSFQDLDRNDYELIGDLYPTERLMTLGALKCRSNDFESDGYRWRSARLTYEWIWKDVIGEEDLQNIMVCDSNELASAAQKKGLMTCYVKKDAAGRQWNGLVESTQIAAATDGIDEVEKQRREKVVTMFEQAKLRVETKSSYYNFKVHGVPIAEAFVGIGLIPGAAAAAYKYRKELAATASAAKIWIKNKWNGPKGGTGSGGEGGSSDEPRRSSDANKEYRALQIRKPQIFSGREVSPGINWMAGAKTLGWGLTTIGAGALTVVLGAGTGAATLCPADGPLGEAALGTATVSTAGWTAAGAAATGASFMMFLDSF